MPDEPQTRSKEAAPVSRRKKAFFAFGAAVFVPVALLLLLEAGLRVAGYGYPTRYFIPRTIGGQSYLTENDKFTWRFFPPELARNPTATRIKRKKEPGTCRIFVFGESAALGDPKPGYGMGRYLEVLLRERFPAARFEVITAAVTAINSHAILPIARECAGLDGDFWVIYAGNNEMLGPFGANPISGPAAPSIARIRATLAVRGTRLGQLIESTTRRFSPSGGDEKSWEGMKTFLTHQVPPNAPERDIVRENFRRNLEDIVRAALRSGARPVVCTVAANLKDCAPFASAQAEESAEARFRAGEAALAAGDGAAAVAAFGKARDYDALPFRVEARMNAMIRATTGALEKEGAILADVENEFARQSPDGLPGDESFFDHVHFTFAGNYRVARILADRIASALPRERQRNEWATAEVCDRALALTDWNRRAACEHMLQRLSEAPFSAQLNHARREESMARAIIEYRNRTQTAEVIAGDRVIYETAIARNGEDFRLRENFAEFLEIRGEFVAATEQWRQVAALLPYQHAPHYQIGRLLSREKKSDEAREAFSRALELRPDLAEAMIELGQIAYRNGDPRKALEEYARAAVLRPRDARLRVLQADALAARGDRNEGMQKLRDAIHLRSNYWEAHYLLGIELAATNRFPEAIGEFTEVTRLRPDYAQARFNLAVAFAKTGQMNDAVREFRKTLELDPNHRLASDYLRAIEAAAQRAR